MFESVTRKKSKVRMALVGPSGSGKTLSALYLAYGITGDWSKIALIDTEHERGRFYAEREDLGTGAFLYASLTPPYSPERYIALVEEGEKAVGSDGVIIIDSFSHAWDNEGGVLEIKDEIVRTTKMNDYTAWNEAGRIQNNLINKILAINCHTIVTMRTKMAYALEQNDNGKMVPVKLGLAPIQRDNTEYEFDVVLQINRQHIASASKDTTFLDNWSGIITSELGKQLSSWLDEGKEPDRCEDCKKLIMPDKKRTVQQIVDGSVKNYGRKLCMNCVKKEIEKRKQNANAETVSE